MAKTRTVTRTLHYEKGRFVSILRSGTRPLNDKELAGKKEVRSVNIGWSDAPHRGLDCDEATSAWLTKQGFGIPVKFTMKLEGIPEKAEFTWKDIRKGPA